MLAKLRSPNRRQRLLRHFDDLSQDISTGDERIAFGDPHNEPAPLFDHQRRRVLGRDHVRQKSLAENRFAIGQIGVPERSPFAHQRIFAGDTVHQDVEPALFAFDTREQRFNFGFYRVIHANYDSRAASGGNLLSGLFDRFRTAIGRGTAARAAARAVHGRPSFRERTRNPSAGASRCTATTATAPVT